MSRGVPWTIDPEAWTIVDGKHYLNYLKSGASFAGDPEPAIESADANWQRLLHEDQRF